MAGVFVVLGWVLAGGPSEVLADRAVQGVPASSRYVGSSSCATFGCHGNIPAENRPAWKSSYVTWASRDPHLRAFHALFSPRSRQIVRQLAVDDSADETGQWYWRVLEQRCIGCHATSAPPAESDAEGAPHGARLASLQNGVSCESCHGAAKYWLAEHATVRWDGYSPEEKRTRWGMTNTDGLASRAELCASCHIGPQVQGEQSFVVDHDLIAAGHPRLVFEFSAYLANLPPHWDAGEDQRQGGATEFHSRTWRVGQLVSAGKLAEQLAERADRGVTGAAGMLDFSHYECFDCHHRWQANRFERPDRLHRDSTRKGDPRPGDTIFRLSRVVAGQLELRELEQGIGTAMHSMTQMGSKSSADAARSWRDLQSQLAAALPIVERPWPTKSRLEAARRLTSELTGPGAPRWDDLVQLQLLLVALSQDTDLGEKRLGEIERVAGSLAAYLHRQFLSGQPSVYASPDGFDPTASDLEKGLHALLRILDTRDEPGS